MSSNNGTGGKYDLTIRFSGYVEPRGDRFFAFNHELGITAYGASSDEAETRLNRAVDLAVKRLAMRGPAAMRTRFANIGVPLILEPTGEPRRRL